ncbi:MAG TPA: sulfatase [Gaiellales bacterium]|nr:sulfatase [Gaiellales bacterium]
MKARWAPGALALVATALLTVSSGSPPAARAAAGPPNIVVILTDDQRYDGLVSMPNVKQLLLPHGVQFTHAFDNNPLCCPSRATFLTGQTSGHTGVWWNVNGPDGGFAAFEPHESQTLATWLSAAGYRTGLFGKYMNGYARANAAHVPPGWDDWQALVLNGNGCSADGYFSECMSDNGALEVFGTAQTDYSTTVLGNRAVQFIQDTPASQPLFMYFAPRAPHLPTIPESRYATACATFPTPHRANYNEADVSDKPAYIRALASMGPTKQATWDGHWRDACRTLRSVDDQVGRLVAALSSAGRLENTLILFASDNGMLFGEHRWTDKIVPYDESLRIPLIARWDAAGTAGTKSSVFVSNVDFAETIMDAAGVPFPAGYTTDGQSLLPVITGSGPIATENVLIEHAGNTPVPVYCGVRVSGWMFTHYATGEEELYDLTADPWETQNLAADPAYAARLDRLRSMTQRLCQPTPPGFAW